MENSGTILESLHTTQKGNLLGIYGKAHTHLWKVFFLCHLSLGCQHASEEKKPQMLFMYQESRRPKLDPSSSAGLVFSKFGRIVTKGHKNSRDLGKRQILLEPSKIPTSKWRRGCKMCFTQQKYVQGVAA